MNGSFVPVFTNIYNLSYFFLAGRDLESEGALFHRILVFLGIVEHFYGNTCYAFKVITHTICISAGR